MLPLAREIYHDFFSLPPTDASLRELFETHEAEFNKLRDMILAEKKIGAVDASYVWTYYFSNRMWHVGGRYSQEEMLERGLMDAERYREYLALLKSIGASNVSKGWEEGQVEIEIYLASVFVYSVSKDIVYLPEPPRRIVDETGHESGRLFSVIRDGWYIRYWQ